MIAVGAVVLAALMLAAHLVSIGIVLSRFAGARRALTRPAEPLPPVTLLRPVCGRDAFDAETLGSSFLQDYPQHELIFCAAREDDPAVPLVRRLIAAHPGVPAQLLIGDDAISGNPKLNNLEKGWRAARTERVAMADSNLLLPPDYLRILAASWQKGVGMVSSPAFGTRPEGFWGALECAFLNGNQARLQLAADSLGIGFAQGKTIYASKPMVDAAGGLAALGRDLAEDVAATKLVRRAGLRVRLTPVPFAQPIGRRSFAAVWSRQLRWSRVRRSGFPAIFLIEPLNGAALPLAATAAAAALGAVPGWVLPAYAALWYGAELWFLRRAGWPGGWRDLLAMVLRDALLPALWLATFRSRSIVWRGTAMRPAGS